MTRATIRWTSMLIAAAATFGAGAAHSQAPAFRHAIGVFGGAWDAGDGGTGSRVTVGPATVEVVGSSGVGGLRYIRQWRDGWALELSAARLSEGDVNVSAFGGVETQAIGVTWMQLGVRRYLGAGGVIPYVGVSGGVVRGTEDGMTVGVGVAAVSRTETSVGGTVGAGCDVPLGRRLLLEFAAAWGAMADFGEPIGGRVDYGGATATLGFSWTWGRID